MQDTSAAIIVAAGTSRRMHGRDKLWTPLAGRITLARTIDVFEISPIIASIILVLNPERMHDAAALSGLLAAQQYEAAIAAVPVKDTIKLVLEGKVSSTIDRSQLWAIQTPQVFSFPLIYQAHHSSAAQRDVTDDAALLEELGQPVMVFPGAYTNIKITTLEDLLLAEAFFKGHVS